jgi:hypothetical protein
MNNMLTHLRLYVRLPTTVPVVPLPQGRETLHPQIRWGWRDVPTSIDKGPEAYERDDLDCVVSLLLTIVVPAKLCFGRNDKWWWTRDQRILDYVCLT